MQNSQIPTKMPVLWGTSAPGGDIRVVPIPSQIGVQAGAASFTDGFPPANFSPVSSGGTPPFGADFNGIFNVLTAWARWFQAGAQIQFDASFSSGGTNIGGYPAGAIVASASYPFLHSWQNIVDNNTASPDSTSPSWTNWQTWPLPGSITAPMLAPAAVPRPIVFAQNADNLIVFNDGTNPNTTVNVNAGRVPDQADTTWCPLAAAMSKLITTGWAAGGAVGSAAGGLDTGSSLAASATYHVYVIGKLGIAISNRARSGNIATITTSSSHGLGAGGTVRVSGVGFGYDGTYLISSVTSTTIVYNNTGGNEGTTAVALATLDGFDILLSQQSVNAYPTPALPSGWSVSQCLGSVLTDGSSHVRPFIQIGDEFKLATPVVSFNNVTTPTGSRTLAALNVPIGVKVLANIRMFANNNTTGGNVNLTSPDENDAAVPASSAAATMRMIANNSDGFGEAWIRTNTSAQIGYRGSTTLPLFVNTLGWRDPRRRTF